MIEEWLHLCDSRDVSSSVNGRRVGESVVSVPCQCQVGGYRTRFIRPNRIYPQKNRYAKNLLLPIPKTAKSTSVALTEDELPLIDVDVAVVTARAFVASAALDAATPLPPVPATTVAVVAWPTAAVAVVDASCLAAVVPAEVAAVDGDDVDDDVSVAEVTEVVVVVVALPVDGGSDVDAPTQGCMRVMTTASATIAETKRHFFQPRKWIALVSSRRGRVALTGESVSQANISSWQSSHSAQLL